jgi:hypothetical protein
MKQMLLRKRRKTRKYSFELRSFALTLIFIPQEDINMLGVWGKQLLPHPATIRDW